IVALLLLAMVPLGMALDPLTILIITMPIAHPVVTDLGYSGIWFGILAVKMIEIGLITPPVGLNAFVVAGAAKDYVNLEETFLGASRFLIVDLLTIVLLFLVPSLVLFLPGLLQ